jgi:PleD family two-component response regulator
MIEEFRLELQSLRSWQEMKASLGLSVGIASGGNGLLRSGQLLARADQALYEAKRTGKNRACLSPTGQAQPLAVSSR